MCKLQYNKSRYKYFLALLTVALWKLFILYMNLLRIINWMILYFTVKDLFDTFSYPRPSHSDWTCHLHVIDKNSHATYKNFHELNSLRHIGPTLTCQLHSWIKFLRITILSGETVPLFLLNYIYIFNF